MRSEISTTKATTNADKWPSDKQRLALLSAKAEANEVDAAADCYIELVDKEAQHLAPLIQKALARVIS